MNDRKHAKLSPSASKRWINCPGSIRLCANVPPPKESKYAAEGTAAHALGEKCLKAGKPAKTYIGEMFEGFTATEEMAEAVQVYVDAVNAIPGTKAIETKIDLSWLHPGMFGSNDATVLQTDKKKLFVFDYKHGQGVIVDPEWNPQLMMYALGAVYSYRLHEIEKVEIVIVQPRARESDEPVKRWEISTSELMFWGRNILKPAAVETESKTAALRVGDHCRFCPAIAACPEQVKHACAIAKTTFGEISLPSPTNMTGEEMAKVMEASAIISTWANEVQAYAQTRAEIGLRIPGYKLVQKRANRAWIDETTAEAALTDALGKHAYEQKLVSPAQAEKLVKKMAVRIDLEPLWTKPEAGLTLVTETDKRHAVNPPAALEFLDTADFLQ